MKAAIYGGVGDLTVEEVPTPDVPPDGMLVKVNNCLLCGTDLKLYTVGNPRCKPPQVIGHEFSARVVDKAPSVTEFEIGDRVTAATSISCGECDLCRKGLGNLCENLRCVSYDYPGALAEYVPIPAQAIKRGNIVKVPDNISDEAASLSEPLSCVLNSHRIAGLERGDSVVIVGSGPLGVLHLVAARAAGAAKVAMVEVSKTRLDVARAFDPDLAVLSSESDAKAAVLEMTKGCGADVVIVAAPAKAATEDAIGLVAKGGRISLFASLPSGASDVVFDSRAIHYRELRICGASDSRPEHVRMALDMIAGGSVPADKIITHRLPLENVTDGIELMKQGLSLKVSIEMGEAA